jgi:hypothetical protein
MKDLEANHTRSSFVRNLFAISNYNRKKYCLLYKWHEVSREILTSYFLYVIILYLKVQCSEQHDRLSMIFWPSGLAEEKSSAGQLSVDHDWWHWDQVSALFL